MYSFYKLLFKKAASRYQFPAHFIFTDTDVQGPWQGAGGAGTMALPRRAHCQQDDNRAPESLERMMAAARDALGCRHAGSAPNIEYCELLRFV